MGKIISFTGVSGTGKTTVVKELSKDKSFAILTSTTTRKPRNSDLPDEYEFVTEQEFDKLKQEHAFLWAVDYAGNKYGTRKEYINQALADNKTHLVILVPEVVHLLVNYAEEKALPFFMLTPDTEILRQRMEVRGETQETINKRLEAADVWEKQAKGTGIPYVFISNNRTVEETMQEINSILKRRL